MSKKSNSSTPPTQRRRPPGVDSILDEYYAFESSLLAEETSFQEAAVANRNADWIYLNHASFGFPYPSTLKLRQYLTDLCYRQPMVYHRSIVPVLVERSRRRVCEYMKIQPRSHVVVVDSNGNYHQTVNHNQGDNDQNSKAFAFVNVTGALFGVLSSFDFREFDVVVTSDMLYHSLVDTLFFLEQKYCLEWIQVPTPPGAKEEDIFLAFERVLLDITTKTNKHVKLVIVDHISSKPSVVFPVQRICHLCKTLLPTTIPTLVDGAHVPGMVPAFDTDIPRIGATFYACTFHKWCNTPRGGSSGGLWVDLDAFSETQPCSNRQRFRDFIDLSRITLHEEGRLMQTSSSKELSLYLHHTSKPGFFTDSLTQGIYDESTREYENIIVLSHCLDLVSRFQDDLQRHFHELRRASRDFLKEAWRLTEEEASLWYGDAVEDNGRDNAGSTSGERQWELGMLSIPLPTDGLLDAMKWQNMDGDIAKTMTRGEKLRVLKRALVPWLWEEYSIEVPVFVWKDSLLGVRISFGRHVRIGDIQQLGMAIVRIIEEGIFVE